MPDALARLSDDLTACAEAAAPGLVTLYPNERAQRTAFAWRPGFVVASEQRLPDAEDAPALLPGGREAVAALVGREPGANLALFKLPIDSPPIADADPRLGALVLALGAADGRPTVSMGVIHQLGPAWNSMAGGAIDRFIQLDIRLPANAEGGPVLSAAGGLLGMSAFGPRRRILVIPASTIRAALPMLLDGGPRGWLGLCLQPVGLPEPLHEAAGRDAGLMVMTLAAKGPAEQAGMLPGDILLDVDGSPARHPRAVACALAGERVGASVSLKLLRGGAPMEIQAVVAARPVH